MKKKVIVIGAGPSGIACALELIKTKKFDVTIVEKSKYIGGISKTIDYKGNKIDIGGHRFFTKNKKVMDFWTSYMKMQGSAAKDEIDKRNYDKNGVNPDKEDDVFLKRRRISRIYYNNRFFDYPIKININTIKNLGFINTFLCGLSYTKASIFKKRETNLENFYINRFGKRLYETFFKDYTIKVWGRSPKEIDASWGRQRVKGISIKTIIKNILMPSKVNETSLIEEFYYPKYGPGQMYTIMTNKFIELGGKLLLNSEVIKINKNMNIVTIKEKDILTNLSADYIVSSMPIVDLINSFDFNVPRNIKEISDNLPYRDFITVGILTKKLKIKNNTNYKTKKNIVPDCWIYIQDKNVKLGRLQIFNNWSPYMIKNNKNNDKIWLGLEYFSNIDDEFYKLSKNKLIDIGIDELEKINILNRKDVIDACVIKQEKAYPAYFDSYKDFDKLRKYLDKFDNLFLIGRNGQHRYNNMDHSILTGLNASYNIINNIKDKDNIWNVNIGDDYHEEINEKDK